MSEPKLSDRAKSLKHGLYEHFKGGTYRLVGVAKNSEKPDEEFVIYQSIDHGLMWARPLTMFLETVEKDGYSGPRFRYIGEESKCN